MKWNVVVSKQLFNDTSVSNYYLFLTWVDYIVETEFTQFLHILMKS